MRRGCAGGASTGRCRSSILPAVPTSRSAISASWNWAAPRPVRDMVMRLAAALDVPLRQHNALLLAAGFAPVWRETDLAAPELAQVRSALDYMLAQQEPFPAVAVDRHWNLLQKQFRRGAPGRIPGRAAAAGCAGQSGRRPGRAGRVAAVSCELGGRGALFHPQRRSRRCRRRHAGNGGVARKTARLSTACGRGLKPGAAKRPRPGAADAFPQRRHASCGCSRPSRRLGLRRTSRCRSFASNAFSRWMMPPPACCAAGRQASVDRFCSEYASRNSLIPASLCRHPEEPRSCAASRRMGRLRPLPSFEARRCAASTSG